LPPGYTPSFPHGVMSGDPQPDGAVIWTKLSPAPGDVDVPVLWEVSDRPDFATITTGGAAVASAADAYAVHVPVTGLGTDGWWYYRFTVGTVVGPVGRLRTAPDPSSSPDSLTVAWTSCQQRGSGYASHRALANEPGVDFFLHLGDYVYVSDGGTLTLDDYRGVYDAFKAEPELQSLQAALPIVSMFDDGEFYNGVDSTGDPARLAAAHQAWFETMPVIAPGADPTQAYRSFSWGDLLELFMIDVRSYRSPAIDETDTSTPAGAAIFDPSRTTLGATQKAWLKDGLAASAGCWKVLGNPYNMGVWRLFDTDPGPPRPPGVHPQQGVYAPNEAWDDYWAERRELLAHVRDRSIDGVVSLSGHTHIWVASELAADIDDPNDPIVAHDFTCGSLTPDPDVILDRGGDPAEAYDYYRQLADLSIGQNTGQKYVNFINHGYGLATFTPDEVTVTFRAVNPYSSSIETVTVAELTVPKATNCLSTTSYSIPCYSCGDPYPRGEAAPVTTTCTPRGGSVTDPGTDPAGPPISARPPFTG
ncbi:MAG: alkaline phosphatase D family protein, partial [Actinomycetota bacterium]